MLPTVLLLLSVFTVGGSGCEDLKRETTSNLQASIRHEEQLGFLSVFPKNYYVQHYFNGSTQCEDSCCVFSAAFLLSDSWKQLLQHIDQRHLKHVLIGELVVTLDNIWKEHFQETPNPANFPSVHSSPRALLTYTSDVLSNWLSLNCPNEKIYCVFPSPAPLFTDKNENKEKEQSITDGKVTEEDSKYGKEGERGKRCLTGTPHNGEKGLFATPSFILFILCCLDVMLKELR